MGRERREERKVSGLVRERRWNVMGAMLLLGWTVFAEMGNCSC